MAGEGSCVARKHKMLWQNESPKQKFYFNEQEYNYRRKSPLKSLIQSIWREVQQYIKYNFTSDEFSGIKPGCCEANDPSWTWSRIGTSR